MKEKPRIGILRTHYPHWGAFTAFNVFSGYLDPERFSIREWRVPMRHAFRSLSRLTGSWVNRLRNGMAVYESADFRAELAVLFHSLLRGLDVVHLVDAEHSLRFLPAWMRMVARIRPAPVVIATFHQPPEVLRSLINPEVVKRVDYLQLVSRSQIEFFRDWFPEDRITTILLGVDTDHFRPSASKSEGETFDCLAGGVWLRDYGTLFQTARLLKPHADMRFHVVAADLEIPADLTNVIQHRRIPDRELLELYRTCDLLFLPLEAATANTFLLEGAACGLPIVSSDLAAVREYFPADSAMLVKGEDPEAFADIILHLSRDSEKRRELARKARQRAEQLSWGRISKLYERLYEAGIHGSSVERGPQAE